ncbi:hypothetical protein SLS62_008544 [Diatrype stigma]|uniref:Pyridoxamine 5'-phosphate oxidase Alr4036 family FMN-binding domain-containing protein n=1 Tax=Diatrype stigma TaxID=117547 RepID=A0AAN9YN41_9PEZI
MSSYSTTTQGEPAPWRSLFLEHVQGMASPEFTLATVRLVKRQRRQGEASSPSPSEGKTATAAVPRARTCVFRGLFAELPANPRNEAERNPAGVYASDLPTFTTDVRMDKLAELFGEEVEEDDGGDGGASRSKPGTGGGGPVEATFWARRAGVQWRIRGRAYVLAPDVEDERGEVSEGAREVVRALRARMRRVVSSEDGEKEKGWSFAREITAHFGNVSPLMRGSFRNPAPGTPVALPVSDDRLGLGQEVADLEDEVARANFRVAVVVPDQVDRTDLSDPRRARRWLYTFVGTGQEPSQPGGVVEAGWEKVEVWP